MKTLVLKTHYKDSLSPLFFSKTLPMKLDKDELLLLNADLALKLGIDPEDLARHPGYFSGRERVPGSIPLAQAYSGHQFGFYTRLGDGRALLLGEWEDEQGKLWDIQLKGAGRTPYSRGGDGKAALAPMLREYLISEAMAALGVPTTRSLALVLTGVPVYREVNLQGAMLTRVAESHLRVGTFQYALEAGGEEALKELTDYAIARHDPDIQNHEKPYFAFLKKVIQRQAKLIVLWLSKAFIHGVMNTDNMSICGETIDYGPCAFMDYYDPEAVFSSIDTKGRYAYGHQPTIAQWNLTRFAESLLPLLTKEGSSVSDVEKELVYFKELFRSYYYDEFRAKLGLFEEDRQDPELLQELLEFMLHHRRDFTNTFVHLSLNDFSDPIYETEEFLLWKRKWQRRQKQEGRTKEIREAMMKKHNPFLIPRNHKVEEVLEAAEEGDMKPFLSYLSLLQRPYFYDDHISQEYISPMDLNEMGDYRTFCGT